MMDVEVRKGIESLDGSISLGALFEAMRERGYNLEGVANGLQALINNGEVSIKGQKILPVNRSKVFNCLADHRIQVYSSKPWDIQLIFKDGERFDCNMIKLYDRADGDVFSECRRIIEVGGEVDVFAEGEQAKKLEARLNYNAEHPQERKFDINIGSLPGEEGVIEAVTCVSTSFKRIGRLLNVQFKAMRVWGFGYSEDKA